MTHTFTLTRTPAHTHTNTRPQPTPPAAVPVGVSTDQATSQPCLKPPAHPARSPVLPRSEAGQSSAPRLALARRPRGPLPLPELEHPGRPVSGPAQALPSVWNFVPTGVLGSPSLTRVPAPCLLREALSTPLSHRRRRPRPPARPAFPHRRGTRRARRREVPAVSLGTESAVWETGFYTPHPRQGPGASSANCGVSPGVIFPFLCSLLWNHADPCYV